MPEKEKRKREYEPGDPYADGYDAALARKPKDANPYAAGSRNHMMWDNGWLRTLDDDDWDDN